MIPTLLLDAFLKAQGYPGQLNDALYRFLRDRGYTKQLNESLYLFLGDRGYVGTLDERIHQWIRDGMAVLPRLVVTNGVVTTFNRESVDYTQVLFAGTGSFTLSDDVEDVDLVLLSGGASGGSRSSSQTGSGGGGGGHPLIQLGYTLLQGTHTVNIGGGGLGVTNSAGNNGGATTLTGPNSLNSPGGGGGGTAIDAPSNLGKPGGNGGGGGGALGAAATGGDGNPGNDGGNGYSSGTFAERAGGGGGGAGGVGGAATIGVAGIGAPGVSLSFLEVPITVGKGGDGSLGAANNTSPNEINGNGTNGIYGSPSGNGGPGMAAFVFRSELIEVA